MNLIALVVFLSSNILTPLSYTSAQFDEAVEPQEKEQEQGEILDIQEPEEDDGEVEDSSVEASDSDEDIQEEDTQDSSEPHPTPLLIGEGSTDEIGTGEVDNETPMDSSATPQNDEDTHE